MANSPTDLRRRATIALRYGAAPGYAKLASDEALLGGQVVRKTILRDAIGVSGPFRVRVNRDDNTSMIARRLGVTVEELVAANPHKRTTVVKGKRVFRNIRDGELLRQPSRTMRVGVGVGVGDPCNPEDDDFDPLACAQGGSGMTTTPLIDLSTDEQAACEAAGGQWTGSECIEKLEGGAIPSGGGGTPTTGGGGGGGGGTTKPGKGSATNTATTGKKPSSSTFMTVLKALGIVAGGAAVVAGGAYLYKKHKKGARKGNPARAAMTKASVIKSFRNRILPGVKRTYGSDDRVAIRVAFNDYVDGLNKRGLVTNEQANNWSNPF